MQEIKDFLSLYQSDSIIRLLRDSIGAPKAKQIQVKGLCGSLDAVLSGAILRSTSKSHLFILHDKEEAARFFDNLRTLQAGKSMFFFPMSYKKMYQSEKVDNANVLMRLETLNHLYKASSQVVVVTYPEALGEKVIHRKFLSTYIFQIKKGDELDRSVLEDKLRNYHFEKTDHVYEPGQYAVRGGIIDVFSFNNELPYRIEFYGNQVDSIRSFNPGSQLSVEQLSALTLMPDVQTKISNQERQSILCFLPPDSCIWCKDIQHTLDTVEKEYEKITTTYQEKIHRDTPTSLLTEPHHLMSPAGEILDICNQHTQIEFGNRFYYNTSAHTYPSKPQPLFKKNFEWLATDLLNYQQQGYQNYILTSQPKQGDRLMEIFHEIHPELAVQCIHFPLHEGFIDDNLRIVCYTEHQIFERHQRYRGRERYSKNKALTWAELETLQPGDYVTHIDYGISKFGGLEKREVNGNQQEFIRLIFRDNDTLYINMHSLRKLSRYKGKEGTMPAMSKLGSEEWVNKKNRARKKIKDIAKELITLYAKRKQSPGIAYDPDDVYQAELEASFIYEDTPDQAKATEEVKRDMMQPHPMDRLVCGDVGFGKTEVAIRAAFKAVSQGKQVAILVPTTLLAFQHYRTFTQRLAHYSVRLDYLSRFKTDKETRAILDKLKAGDLQIIIGTHRIVNHQDVVFKNLGLLIIDEEQKFGVKVKDRLKEIKINVDVLTLTATPIPRTLHFSLMGARDLSIITTPPPNRQSVTTELHTFDESLIRDVMSQELQRGGQAFFVHHRVSDIEHMANVIFRLLPDARIGIAHGQMRGHKLEKVMLKFINAEYDILVATNIIESGLDIPNANTIIINQSHLFGLSDLHQMRGRVGRSNKKGYCYLICPPTSTLSGDARKRLLAFEEFSELGDGFKIAMRDLDIRGAGNLLGAEQSGFITDLGFDAYCQILDEAVHEVKTSDFSELFRAQEDLNRRPGNLECLIETDMELIIPHDYVSNVSERLRLYVALDKVADEKALTEFSLSLSDQYGAFPLPVQQLLDTVRLRWVGRNLNIEKIQIKKNQLKAHFSNHHHALQSSSNGFEKIIQFVHQQAHRCKIKQTQDKLTLSITEVETVEKALHTLQAILQTEPRKDVLSLQ